MNHKASLLLIMAFSLASCSTPSRGPASTDGAYSVPLDKIQVVGGDEKSFRPPAPNGAPEPLGKDYDVVVVGSGLSGLSASIFLAEAGKSVLVLEKEATFGGLAQGTTFPGTDVRFDRGAAYWTSAYEEEQQILQRIGLGDFQTKHPIPEPIDSYYWNGKMYPGIWDDETLKDLPASFALFKNELNKASDEGLIPDQPIEEAPKMDLDRYSAAGWIRSMPGKAAKRTDDDSKAIYARYKAELKSGKIPASDPMAGVVGLMDLYCRSALGTTSQYVSAIAFANFYISEVVTRYTTQIGTGQAAENMVKLLGTHDNVSLQASSPVLHIKNGADGVDTTYAQNGKAYSVHSKYLVFAAQLKFAPRIIDGFAAGAPEQAALMSSMAYSDYSVHAVEVKGHPYRLTYDTWTRATDANDHDFTDFILGRWMDPSLNGYDGFRDFKSDPPGNSIITIYHPLPLGFTGSGYDDHQAKLVAAHAVSRLLQIYSPFLAQNYKTKFEILGVQTSRWPFSVHVAVPGHFIKKVKIMRKPFGRVFFGNNNLGTPAFEEALFRGHCAANNVLAHMDSSFAPEAWSRCVIEK
ncbi:MAG: FAD-dependent oxidoreductase [Bdellovibrionota bacterium]